MNYSFRTSKSILSTIRLKCLTTIRTFPWTRNLIFFHWAVSCMRLFTASIPLRASSLTSISFMKSRKASLVSLFKRFSGRIRNGLMFSNYCKSFKINSRKTPHNQNRPTHPQLPRANRQKTHTVFSMTSVQCSTSTQNKHKVHT